jgi:peptidoglycan/LPS O-acetylase OafA/YrhL
LIAVALAVGLPVLNGRPMLEWSALLAHLGYLNDILGLKWASGVFWTLAIEFQFYLFMAVAFLGYTSSSNFKSLVFIAATLILSLIFQDRIYLPAWLSFFAVGALLFRRMTLNMPIVLFLPAIIFTLLPIFFLFGIPELIAVSFSILFILFVRLKDSNFFEKLLVNLGVISYSLYLIHIELNKLALRLTSFIPLLVNHSLLRLTVSIAFAICVAAIFYFLIERPFKQKSSSIKYEKSS